MKKDKPTKKRTCFLKTIPIFDMGIGDSISFDMEHNMRNLINLNVKLRKQFERIGLTWSFRFDKDDKGKIRMTRYNPNKAI